MRIVLLHNDCGDDASADDRDVLEQRDAVADSLARLGHETETLPCALDLGPVVDRLRRDPPDLVFNLVESLAGSDRLLVVAPLLLDSLAVPYTGSGADAAYLTTNKLLAKERLASRGLPTAPWWTTEGRGDTTTGAARFHDSRIGDSRVIVKTVWEHASFGLDDEGVVFEESRDEAIVARVRERSRELRRECFAEEFIDGREFNLALLADDSETGARVLPPAEIDFSGFPEDRPRIVGYRAKWDETSVESRHTVRRFRSGSGDRELHACLEKLAREAWDLFRPGGYARVDFRVDADGKPWILEVNTNPCLSPDAGFAAALTRAEIPFDEAIARILSAALRRAPATLDPPIVRSSPTQTPPRAKPAAVERKK